MSTEETQNFLEQELEHRIASFKSRRNSYRTGAYTFIISTSVLSAATTVSIGLGEIFSSQATRIFALFVSSILSILTAWEGFFGHRQRWIQTNETLMELYELRSDIIFQKTLHPLTQEELKNFYSRYSEILRQANQQWTETRQKNPISQSFKRDDK